MYLLPFAIILLIFIVIAFIKPFWGFIIFTGLLYLRPGDFFPALGNAHPVRIIAVATLLAAFLQKKEMFSYALRGHRQIIYLTILMFTATVSIITSIWRSHSLEYFLSIIKIYPAFLMIIVLVDSAAKMRKIIWTMLFFMLFIVIMAITSGVYVETYRMRGIGQGMFGDPNDLALSLIMHIPFVIYFLKERGGVIKKLILAGILMVLLFGIILTHSRGGLIGLLAVAILIFLKSRSKVKMSIGLAILVTFFLFVMPNTYKERMMDISTSYKEDPSTISRIDAWKAGLAMMKHHLFGVGIGNFGEGFVRYRPLNAIDVPGKRQQPHNAFIQVGGEIGLSGLLFFILLFVSSFNYLKRIKNKCAKLHTKESAELLLYADATYISLFGFLTCSLFLGQAYHWLLYYLFAFTIVLINLEKRLIT